MINLCLVQGTVIAEPVYVQTAPAKHRLAYVWICHQRPMRNYKRRKKGSPKPEISRTRRHRDYIRLKAWDGNADFIKRYFRPGTIVTVEGTMQNDFVHNNNKVVRRLLVTVKKIHTTDHRDWDQDMMEKLQELAEENTRVEEGEVIRDQEPIDELCVADNFQNIDWGSSWLGLKVVGENRIVQTPTPPKHEAPVEGENWDVELPPEDDLDEFD